MFMLVFGKGVQSSVTVHGEPGTRRRGTSLNTLFNITEIAGDKYIHPMTLRLNT